MGIKYTLIVWLFFPILSFAQNVGINTSNPQQVLHIGGAESNMRIDAFNSGNSTNNTSSTVTAPLYVDHEGVLTLEFEPYYANDGNDEFVAAGDYNNYIIQHGTAEVVEEIIFTHDSIYVPRPSYIHVTYSMSFSVKYDRFGNTITDDLARVIQNYITVDGVFSGDGSGNLRKYAMAAQCYINGEAAVGTSNGAHDILYNSASAYIYVEEGWHTINFHGGVGSGSATVSTVVEFGMGEDMLLIRLF